MAGVAGIQVIGLREFRTRVAACSRRQPNIMRLGLNAVGQTIVDEARIKFPSELSSDPYNASRRTGRLEGSLRARSTAREGRVVEGSETRIPYAGWWEFGGPSRPSNRPPNRPFRREGRVLYPTLKSAPVQEAIVRDMELVLRALVEFIERG
jgi:hypothetical protein